MRKFEKVSLNEFVKYYDEAIYDDILLPTRSTKFSAGYDFYLPSDTIIKAHSFVSIKTGIKVLCEKDEFLMIVVRSSIGIKKNLRLKNQVGIIDYDYYNNCSNDGHIMIAIENTSDDDVVLLKGERIAQGIFLKYYCVAEEAENKDLRVGGFGSTNENK